MAASVEIAGRDIGLGRRRRARIVSEKVRQYREAMRSFAARRHLDVWCERRNAGELDDRLGREVGANCRILVLRTLQKD
jgi:hypothetical protein